MTFKNFLITKFTLLFNIVTLNTINPSNLFYGQNLQKAQCRHAPKIRGKIFTELVTKSSDE